jgi:prophage DNA circulation protein
MADVLSTVSALTGLAKPATFWSQVRPASWRGFKFVVEDTSASFGRRNAVHEYPFRDLPWVEDLGQAAKRFQVRGFIFGDDVIAQRDKLTKLADEKADGELVHPTLGTRKVALLDLRCHERKDRGRYFELLFTFVQQGAQVYPAAINSTGAKTKAKVGLAQLAVLGSFGAAMAGALAAGQAALAKVSDVTASAMSALDKLGTSIGLQPGRLSLAASAIAGDLIRGRTSTAALRLALDELQVATSVLDGTTVGKYAASVVNAVGAAALTGTLSKDWLRNLVGMSTMGALLESSPQASTTSYPAGAQVSQANEASKALFRRAQVIAAANLTADYQPSSAADAAQVRTMVASALQAEIDSAGDSGDDAVYTALKALRAAVVEDLNTRAAQLPTLMTVRTQAPVPSLVLAYRLYGDASRSDELIAEAAPVHPAFMPTIIKVLSS